MQNRARVAIVGATLTGCAIAEHLTQAGLDDVIVLDAGKIPGSVDYPDDDPGFVVRAAIPLVMQEAVQKSLSIAAELSFKDEPAFEPVGSLTVSRYRNEDSGLADLAGRLTQTGVSCAAISGAALSSRLPLLSPDRIGSGLYCAHDGLLRVHVARAALTLRAMATDRAVFRGGARVISVGTTNGGYRLETPVGSVDAQTLVWCVRDLSPLTTGSRTALMNRPTGRFVYGESRPLDGLKWLSHSEASLPALLDRDHGFFYRQNHASWGVATPMGRSNDPDSTAASALHQSRDIMPPLARAVLGTAGPIPRPAVAETDVASLLRPLDGSGKSMVASGIPAMLAIALGAITADSLCRRLGWQGRSSPASDSGRGHASDDALHTASVGLARASDAGVHPFTSATVH